MRLTPEQAASIRSAARDAPSRMTRPILLPSSRTARRAEPGSSTASARIAAVQPAAIQPATAGTLDSRLRRNDSNKAMSSRTARRAEPGSSAASARVAAVQLAAIQPATAGTLDSRLRGNDSNKATSSRTARRAEPGSSAASARVAAVQPAAIQPATAETLDSRLRGNDDNTAETLDDQLRCCEALPACAGMTTIKQRHPGRPAGPSRDPAPRLRASRRCSLLRSSLRRQSHWIPAFAGMTTTRQRHWIPACAGTTAIKQRHPGRPAGPSRDPAPRLRASQRCSLLRSSLRRQRHWIPAFAGMTTTRQEHWIPACAGTTAIKQCHPGRPAGPSRDPARATVEAA